MPRAAAKVSKAKPFDPLEVDRRLYEQVSKLLDQMDDPDTTMRERIMGLAAIARIRVAYVRLNDSRDELDAGSSVRKYAAAFAKNAKGDGTGAGRKHPRLAATSDAFDDGASADFDDDDAA